jgi:hypothetical protein
MLDAVFASDAVDGARSFRQLAFAYQTPPGLGGGSTDGGPRRGFPHVLVENVSNWRMVRGRYMSEVLTSL